MKLVIAKYREDVSWAYKLPVEVVIVDKSEGGDLPNNAGREANSYFWYILANWGNLEGEYVFSQGRYDDQAPELPSQIEHKRYFGHEYQCDANGFPNYPNLCLDRYCEEFGLPKQQKYFFKCGAFFKVSAEEIKMYPREWYEKAFEISSVEKESSHCFERLWPIIFPRLQPDIAIATYE